jgi:hypothetical protein
MLLLTPSQPTCWNGIVEYQMCPLAAHLSVCLSVRRLIRLRQGVGKEGSKSTHYNIQLDLKDLRVPWFWSPLVVEAAVHLWSFCKIPPLLYYNHQLDSSTNSGDQVCMFSKFEPLSQNALSRHACTIAQAIIFAKFCQLLFFTEKTLWCSWQAGYCRAWAVAGWPKGGKEAQLAIQSKYKRARTHSSSRHI